MNEAYFSGVGTRTLNERLQFADDVRNTALENGISPHWKPNYEELFRTVVKTSMHDTAEKMLFEGADFTETNDQFFQMTRGLQQLICIAVKAVMKHPDMGYFHWGAWCTKNLNKLCPVGQTYLAECLVFFYALRRHVS